MHFICVSLIGCAAPPPAPVARAQANGVVAILMPGGSGQPNPRDFLIRNRERFARSGIRTVLASAPWQAVALSRSESRRARLPPTLVVQNRYDRCLGTTPRNVPGFRRWAEGRVTVHWARIDGPPAFHGPCTPFAAHGFFGHDRPEIEAILTFIR